MPPHTQEPAVLDSTLTASPASVRSTAGRVPAYALQPRLLSADGLQDYKDFSKTLHNLWTRLDVLLKALERESTESSPVRDACQQSLRTRMPLFLKQASHLVERMTEGDDNSSMVARLRSTISLVLAAQYLDTIESAVTSEARTIYERELGAILGRAEVPTLFRVSHWVAPVLAFDLPAGPTAEASVTDEDADSIPLHVVVEPVVTFRADDLVENKERRTTIPRFAVEIEQCKHRPQDFGEGAGTLGVAFVKVRVAPLDQKQPVLRVWGDEEVEKLRLKEARAVQLNAFPPKPRAHLDLYTSYVYGDAGVTATIIIKTCITEKGEVPNLRIEMFVDP